jgi:hypothetical protein
MSLENNLKDQKLKNLLDEHSDNVITAPKIRAHRLNARAVGSLPTIAEDNVDEEEIDCNKLGLKRQDKSRQIPRSVRQSNDYDSKKIYSRNQSQCAGGVS